MNCQSCGKQTVENEWGNWCDPCGGVVMNFGEGTKRSTRLIFRHVATVHGAGGRFPVVFDLTANEYGVAWPKKMHNVRCVHCGKDTPVDNRSGLAVLEEMRGGHIYASSRGSLDAMLALAQPLAMGESQEVPELSAAPSATAVEYVTLFPDGAIRKN